MIKQRLVVNCNQVNSISHMGKNKYNIKLSILEISPEGPIKIHKDLYSDKRVDFYFVTHNKRVDKSLGFFKGNTWAENRNHLFQLVPKKYDYYCFIDYDVELNSLTKKSVIDQIFNDLNTYHPAVLVPTNIINIEENNKINRNMYKCGLFSNTQIKIYHKSIIDYIFPLPTQFGGFWDASSTANILEIPLKEYIIASPKMTNRSLISSSYKHNRDMKYGFDSMQKAYNWVYPSIKQNEPDQITELKNKYMKLKKNIKIKKSNPNIDYSTFQSISNYFNLNHKLFKNFNKYRNE